MKRIITALAVTSALVIAAPATALSGKLSTTKAVSAATNALSGAFGWSNTSEDHFLVDGCTQPTPRKVHCQYHLYGRDTDSGVPYVFHCHGTVTVSQKKHSKKLRITATDPSGCEQEFTYNPNTGFPVPGPLPH